MQQKMSLLEDWCWDLQRCYYQCDVYAVKRESGIFRRVLDEVVYFLHLKTFFEGRSRL